MYITKSFFNHGVTVKVYFETSKKKFTDTVKHWFEISTFKCVSYVSSASQADIVVFGPVWIGSTEERDPSKQYLFVDSMKTMALSLPENYTVLSPTSDIARVISVMVDKVYYKILKKPARTIIPVDFARKIRERASA